MPDLRALAAELGAAVPERVLVHGSAPRRASDLDLLVRPAARAALERWLPGAGFTRRPQGWLRVADGRADVVDLTDAADWGLPADELDALFAVAEPLDGLEHVVAPAPAHALLVLARRLQANGGRLGHRRLVRGRQALDRDPDAIAGARARAQAWGCAGALEVLAADLEGRQLTDGERRDLLGRDGAGLVPAWRAGLVLPRPRGQRGAVVAVCGLDGAGKNTVARAVRDALAGLDHEPVVLWHRISYGRALHVVAAPVRLAKAVRGRGAAPASPTAAAPAAQAPVLSAEPASGSSRLWPLVVTLVHVLTAGPVTRWHLRRGRTVLRHRWVLDSLVHQRFRYGPAAPAGLHRALLVRGLPRPAVALFLDVPAEVARRRKPEQFDLAQLTAQRALYLEHADEVGAVRLDGTLPPAQLQDEAVRRVLQALEQRRR